jgi:hypothetical protein
MNYLELKNDKLNIQEITDLVSAPDCGAISLFVGIVTFDATPTHSSTLTIFKLRHN